MPQVSQFETVAKTFLEQHPYGTVIYADQMLTWAGAQDDGLHTDLLIGDPNKQVSAVRRHLNHGGASHNLAEDGRFYLAVDDAKRKSYIVVKLAEHVNKQAELAFGKSISGALSPLNGTQKAIKDIKLDELSGAERQALETNLQDVVAVATPMRKLLNDQVVGHWVKKLEAKGYTAQQARDLIEVLPTLTRYMKLLKATA